MDSMLSDGTYGSAPGVTNYIKYAEVQITSVNATNTVDPLITGLDAQNGAGIYVMNGAIKVNNMMIDLVNAS